MALQHAVEDQVMQRDRGLERIADDVVEIEALEPLAVGEAIGMNDDQEPEFLRLFPERRGDRIGQFLAVDIGQDLHTLEAELGDALQFLRGFVAIGQRHRAERDQAVRLLGAIFRDAVIDELRRLHAGFDRQRVIALAGRRLDHLHVDAHGVEIAQPRLEFHDAVLQVLVLLGIDRGGFRGLELCRPGLTRAFCCAT